MGRLSLIKQNDVIFLAWLPNSAGSMLPDGTFHTSPLTGHPAASITGDPFMSIKSRSMLRVVADPTPTGDSSSGADALQRMRCSDASAKSVWNVAIARVFYSTS